MLVTLLERLEAYRCDSEVLLLEYSSMRYYQSDVVVILSGDYIWNDLAPEGKHLQLSLLERWNKYEKLISHLTSGLPNPPKSKLEDAFKRIMRIISQQGFTYYATNSKALKVLNEAAVDIRHTLEQYFSFSPSHVLLIPDTNILLANPRLDAWPIPFEKWEIILMPVVLSELDQHKVNHRNSEVRDKAASLIRSIKEYRRRGDLHDGVHIIKSKSRLRTIAVEPDLATMLPWFSESSADDRFLAATMEVIRNNLGSHVAVLTNDINMQNKAAFAGIPFLDIEEL